MPVAQCYDDNWQVDSMRVQDNGDREIINVIKTKALKKHLRYPNFSSWISIS